jgi:hypothetical protein
MWSFNSYKKVYDALSKKEGGSKDQTFLPWEHFPLISFSTCFVIYFISFLFHLFVSYFVVWQKSRLSLKHIDPRTGLWQELKLSQPRRLQIIGLPLSVKSEGQIHERWENRMSDWKLEKKGKSFDWNMFYKISCVEHPCIFLWDGFMTTLLLN